MQTLQNTNTKKSKEMPELWGKQGGIIKWIIIGFVAICIIGAAAGGNNSNKKKDTKSKSGSETSGGSSQSETEKEQIEYTPVTATQLSEQLSNNAMKAENDYKDKYIEVTGKLGNIDSGGKYIGIDSDIEFDLTNIQCYIKSDEQKQIIMEMSKGDPITIKGRCKDVGELLGYSIDIDSITKN